VTDRRIEQILYHRLILLDLASAMRHESKMKGPLFVVLPALYAEIRAFRARIFKSDKLNIKQ